ncbi:hypothetical protein [Lunatimonas salinarum]|uniref:hypothetical protein n=1 Tax=Lunatimonas salinarum TaxID=1774590 RepID=UPI001AE0A16C|nr:hypothetical protein [Lunatimonas salinarum]
MEITKNRSLALWLVLLFSCSEKEVRLSENPTQLDKYFPLSEFVLSQIELLDGKEIEKILLLGESQETIIQKLDSVGWRRELDLFIQSDINKASLAGSYKIAEMPDGVVYTRIEGQPGDVQELRVTTEGDRILQVSFTYKKASFFYLSEGAGSLSIDPNTGLLDSYEVIGHQKVWLLSANDMQLKATVRK